MNCDSLLRLLEETPLPAWTGEQRADAHAHCGSCDSCRIQLRQEEALFSMFDDMTLPEPTATFQLPAHAEPRRSMSALFPHLFSRAAIVFLGIGSLFQLFREGDFAPSWVADVYRVESVMLLVQSAPLPTLGLILIGLVYALTGEEFPAITARRQ